MPLEVELPVVPCPGDGSLIDELFSPLGFELEIERHPLDPQFPKWGGSSYFSVVLSGEAVLSEMLSQLYLLLPVLDGEKHYWVDDREVEKLERHGQGYTRPDNLERLRKRNVGKKRSLARREFALGVEALERFLRKEPLRRVHECVFGVLALESEPVNPTL